VARPSVWRSTPPPPERREPTPASPPTAGARQSSLARAAGPAVTELSLQRRWFYFAESVGGSVLLVLTLSRTQPARPRSPPTVSTRDRARSSRQRLTFCGRLFLVVMMSISYSCGRRACSISPRADLTRTAHAMIFADPVRSGLPRLGQFALDRDGLAAAIDRAHVFPCRMYHSFGIVVTRSHHADFVILLRFLAVFGRTDDVPVRGCVDCRRHPEDCGEMSCASLKTSLLLV